MASSTRCSSKRLHNLSEAEFMSPVSDSNSESKTVPFEFSPKKSYAPSQEKGKCNKKLRWGEANDFTAADMRLFWSAKQKDKFLAFNSRPIITGRMISLEQLEDSHCAVSAYFKAQNLSLFFQRCGLVVYEEPVRMFYANLRVSKDSGELETLVLGKRIILNDSLFEKIFKTKFSGDIPFMTGCWLDDFEVTLDEAKIFVAESGSDLSDFGPSTLCFENHILAHIIATTLLPRKGSLSNITDRDVFVLYCLLKKYKINWGEWFRTYMIESAVESDTHAILPYGLIISRILIGLYIDLFYYKPLEVSVTYDIRTFASMGYILIDGKWSKKGPVKLKVKQPWASKKTTNSESLLKEVAEINEMQHKQEKMDKVLHQPKDTGTNVGKVRISMDSIHQQERIKTNKLINQVDSLDHGANSSQNELVVTIQTSFSNLPWNVERSNNSFAGRIINTLKYFFSKCF